MLWEVEILPAEGDRDFEGQRVLSSATVQGIRGLRTVHSARSYLIQGELSQADVVRAAEQILCDGVVEQFRVHALPCTERSTATVDLNVLRHPGVTDSVAENALRALTDSDFSVTAVATCRKYRLNGDLDQAIVDRVASRVLANDAIEHVIQGSLNIKDLSVGSDYSFQLNHIAIRDMDDTALTKLSAVGQLYLSLTEMQTIRDHFQSLDRDPTDIELETVAQTWSEHCSHKTLAGRIHYVETSNGETVNDIHFNNMLKETIFQATVAIRDSHGQNDWCVSVFEDNAGIVKFDEKQNVCIKVETHNHPSALEPYGGANTGLGGVIRDPLGTGMGARPVCSTDVFCFAPPDTPADQLPPGVLHPRAVMQGVVSGVRDYGNRMGIPTVNGAVCFDDRYLGNPLVYCGNVAIMPVDQCEKHMQPGDLIVAVGGRTGRDGIHGATFSSAELTEDSEALSGGAVQIGNPVTEKMMLDVILEARDRGLYSAITDCGAGGFSSAVGEMGEKTGAEVWLERCPLKYSGLSYTEIWISEAQERMVLAVPEKHCEEFRTLCGSEGVEATVIGKFTDDRQLVLKYEDNEVGRMQMSFLHDGRPPVIRKAVFDIASDHPVPVTPKPDFTADLIAILGSLNVASKEWIIRQYDHEVQGGSVIKPLVGVENDGPSDAAVVRPDLTSPRGLVISCGINPHLGDADPRWMAASAIDEAVRNCVAVGADPARIAILDNFCWGNTERTETLGTLVRASIACHDVAIAFGTPFVSGKDSLNNEFSYEDENNNRNTVAIPSTLLITAMGQVANIETCVTMDLKAPGNKLFVVGATADEMRGSHFCLVNKLAGGTVPKVDLSRAPKIFRALHSAIQSGLVRSCHDLSEGGLAASIAEMAFAGGVGAIVSLADVPSAGNLSDVALLFSESNTRFVVEIEPNNVQAFTEVVKEVPSGCIGETAATESVKITASSGEVLIDSPLATLKEAWQAPLRDV
jgi:phosphoribosylformylglycinamidine synthase subunit PurSL